MKKIALFGTSADPPTAGHQAILKWLSDRFDLVVVWASDNPFKEGQTPLKHRIEMLRLAIAEIDTPRNNIELHEEISDRRTLLVLNKAREIWGEDAEYTLIIGADLVKQIRNWYRIEELLQEVQLLVIPRPGYTVEEKNLESLRNLGGDCSIAEFQAPAVSSTAYRQEKDTNNITSAVRNYIEQVNLYSKSD